MPYIPDEHKQYPVLPYSRKNGGEVFEYHSLPTYELNELIGVQLMPYGYNSYEEYFAKIDGLIKEHAGETAVVNLLMVIKEEIDRCNHKEDWSICRFVGEDIGEVTGMHHGGYYYWPCSYSNPNYSGVIDDEEFTAYVYPTDPDLWEIIVDPTGMAYRTIFEGQNAKTLDEYNHMIEQLHDMRPEDFHNVQTF